jgi:serine/threonine protein phosphatase PrpC
VSAVAGAANESYASFVPRKKTGAGRFGLPSPDSDLPDISDIDWFGGGHEDIPRASSEDVEEEKRPDSPTNGASMVDEGSGSGEQLLHNKRVKLTESGSGVPSATSSPAGPFAQQAPTVPVVPSPSSALTRSAQSNVLSSFGQDSFFSLSNSAFGCCVLGVADGVGGWRDNGVDSGEISRALMRASRDIALRQSVQAARNRTPADSFTLSPSDILTRAYAQVKGAGEVEAGSTTACIVALTRAPATTQTQFDAEEDVRRQRAAAASAAAAAAAETVAAAASSSNVVGAMGSAAAAMMHDIAAAVSLQSEQFVAIVVGGRNGNGNGHGSEGAPMSDEHSVSQPINIPSPPGSVSVSVSDTEEGSPEPPMLIPSSPPGTNVAASATAPLPSTPDTPPSLLSPTNQQTGTAASAASRSEDTSSVFLSAANLGDSGYLILRRDQLASDHETATGAYHIVTASDLQRTSVNKDSRCVGCHTLSARPFAHFSVVIRARVSCLVVAR